MSLFRYGEFETELDFTDADTLIAMEDAYEKLQESVEKLPKTGRLADMIKAQNAVYDDFFNSFLGEGASNVMFHSNSLEKRIDAAEKLADFRFREDERFTGRVERFSVNKPGSREQRRNGQRQKKHKTRG